MITPTLEAALYSPVKQFLERQGYEVKGEVRGCDLVARRGDEPPVIVELKLRFSLPLVLQGIDRLALDGAGLSRGAAARAARPRRPLAAGAARDPQAVPPARTGADPGRPHPEDGRDPGGAGALPAAPGEIAGAAAGRRILAPGRRCECRRGGRRAARHRLSPGRIALRPRARARRADAGRRAAERGGRAAGRAHSAAQCLRLVRPHRARHLPLTPKGRPGAEPFCRGVRRPRPAAMITDYGEERQRSLILDYFGSEARIRVLRRAEIFGAAVFVVDFDRGPRHFRTLGSFGAGAQVTEQSSMDLLYPARLVFHYERLMSLAFAMSRAVDQCAAARGRRRRDVALYARLSAGLRAHPGRFRRDHRRDRPPLVLPEAAGRARHGAAISRRDDRRATT